MKAFIYWINDLLKNSVHLFIIDNMLKVHSIWSSSHKMFNINSQVVYIIPHWTISRRPRRLHWTGEGHTSSCSAFNVFPLLFWREFPKSRQDQFLINLFIRLKVICLCLYFSSILRLNCSLSCLHIYVSNLTLSICVPSAHASSVF